MKRDYTRIFNGYKVEHYANADSLLVYTDYCFTPQKYAELCREYGDLIRNACKIRNAKVPNGDEFRRIVETLDPKSDAQKEFERKAAE